MAILTMLCAAISAAAELTSASAPRSTKWRALRDSCRLMRSDSKIASVSRRRFLATGASSTAGLVVGFYAPTSNGFFARMLAESRENVFAPNAFLRVATDNTVTVVSKHQEGGQGIYTGLATIIAEELDADWSQVRVEPAPADRDLYKNLQFGSQGTGGSNSIANSYEQYRRAGATARAMLVAAAADRWRVPSGEITVEKGLVKTRVVATAGEFRQTGPSGRIRAHTCTSHTQRPEEFHIDRS
jgi:isoquinoline 1-oxidoreductase beta subunit